MRPGKLQLIAVAGVVLTAVVIVFALSRNREPEYRGKRLSYWVEHFDEPLGKTRYDATNAIFILRNDDADAVRQIGTNALPYLVKWMTYDLPTRWGWKDYGLFEGMFRNETDARRALGAAVACEELGPEGLPILRQALTNVAPASRTLLMVTIRRIEATAATRTSAPEKNGSQ